jgi:hypothetical protein
MSKKLFISLAPLLAITAFAVMPMVAQAEGTHYYKNGTKLKEGVKTPTISWGTLTLTSGAGTVSCKNVVGGYAENPVGGGAGVGVTQNFATYECVTAECPLETRAEGITNPEKNGNKGWFGSITEAEGVSRLETTGVDVIIGCWTQGPSGSGAGSTSERGTPVAPLLPFKGTSTPKLKNGTTAGKPSKVEFGPGSGELINETVGAGKTTGSVSTLGYTEQELITTGA